MPQVNAGMLTRESVSILLLVFIESRLRVYSCWRTVHVMSTLAFDGGLLAPYIAQCSSGCTSWHHCLLLRSLSQTSRMLQLLISGCWFHYAQAVVRRMKKNWDFKRHTRRRNRHSWRFDVFCRSLSYHPMKLNLASKTCSRWT